MTRSTSSTPRLHRERQVRLSPGAALAQFAPDRRCTHPECGARLSRYNPSATCSVHDGWADTRTRSYG